ncbi:DUF3465 domain-containing protein [Ketobacter sp. MCCC 1A13808]|uniref:DUF3465 domain-containing protein n=1 Tax=Ketobacter sp. MCCC 1A13808 TaxID=2602738 RepID=UPI000F23219A|nr:DUF3465 domain-containing protein [Ketobacter sp. MCCC 1A13808]MVF12169.1 DUF3465 domain-containing protein [Ketobacter sp. MCCC 1A13808]RLP53222.1 MAG: DUF3465 domain-containing protein [Ketobacter sp.]
MLKAHNIKKIKYVLLLLVGLTYYLLGGDLGLSDSSVPSGSAAGSEVYAAFQDKKSDVQVRGYGTVSRVLPDDLKGSRHQKFILDLPSGIGILVAHNIDLAPRIPQLRKGDKVAFFGEYEWNDKGGVVHWTHHDPSARHIDGWLEHDGEKFQ